MQTFGIITNATKDPGFKVTKQLTEILESHNLVFCYDKSTAKALQSDRIIDFEKTDILLVLGGDGTMLQAARLAAPYSAKLFGLNLGHLGFLSDIEISDIGSAIEQIKSGAYFLEKRAMLEASIEGKPPFLALNEATVTQHRILKMVRMQVTVNDNLVYNLFGDGVIVSTATGSTGYSLSAGGPILSPELDNFVITPICAHTVKARSVVISGNDVVKVRSQSEAACILSIDGNAAGEIGNGESVSIRKSAFTADFIKLKQNNFYNLLNQKLTEWD